MKNNKNKAFYTLSIFLVFLLAFTVKVSAISLGVEADAKVQVDSEKSSASATGTAKMESGESNENDKDEVRSTTSVKIEDDSQGDEHRSSVANVVKSLLSISDRDGGIGEDVRVVAREQASTSVKVKEDMDELNSESRVKVFLFGPNYKNLGELRSSIVTTQNHIERLKKAEQRTTSSTTKAELQVQIKALEDVASSTDVFVKANESKLSIFGWFVHIFVK